MFAFRIGCKWTFQQLRQHLRQAGINDWLLWQKISVLVSLTLASQSTGIPNTSNCFELYGFDILVDSDLKPWLLEVKLTLNDNIIYFIRIDAIRKHFLSSIKGFL